MEKTTLTLSRLLPKKDRVIGLDIGHSAIKLAEIKYVKGHPEVVNFQLQKVSRDSSPIQAQADALTKLIKGYNLKHADVHVVIDDAQCCTRVVILPMMPRLEILSALQWKLKETLSYSVDDAVIDYKILETLHEGAARKLKVAVACCPQDTMSHYFEMFQQVGVQPTLLTLQGFALNTVGQHYGRGQTLALLDMGGALSELLFYHDHDLTFSRKLPVAGNNFTQDMTQTLASGTGKIEMTGAEAERIKCKYGIPDTKNKEVLEKDIQVAQIMSLIRPNLERMVTEIDRSFSFYHEKEPQAVIDHLYLLGGGCSLKHLSEYLQEQLGVPVSWFDPVKGMATVDPTLLCKPQTLQRYSSALGAALTPVSGINLIPKHKQQPTRTLVKRASLKAMATAAVVGVVLLYIGLRIHLGVYHVRTEAAQRELQALAPDIALLPKELYLEQARLDTVYWHDSLKEISHLIPQGVCLTEMKAGGLHLVLKGKVRTPLAEREQTLMNFMQSLDQGIFENTHLVSTADNLDEALNTFELRLTLE